jgi:hypothetical protein
MNGEKVIRAIKLTITSNISIDNSKLDEVSQQHASAKGY